MRVQWVGMHAVKYTETVAEAELKPVGPAVEGRARRSGDSDA